MIEPGRSIVGPAGVLLTRVLYRKTERRKEFVIVDAAMNDLIRPALYRVPSRDHAAAQDARPDIVARRGGPGLRDRRLSGARPRGGRRAPGDYLAVCTAGAYGFVQSSNYNSRPRAPEILVEGDQFRTIRARETYADLVRGEVV